MYLYGRRSAGNLGYYARGVRSPALLGSLGYRPNQAVQRQVYSFRGRKQPVRPKLSGYRGIGQDESDLFSDDLFGTSTGSFGPSDLLAPTPDTSGDLTITSADYVNTPYTPGSPADVYSTAIATGAGTNAADTAAYQALQSQVTPVSNITDYVSPAAAIAAGAPASAVNAVWATSQGVNSFSSPSAATAALTASMGAAAAAAAVAKLWTGGGQAAPTTGTFLQSSTAGIPNTVLLVGGGLILVLGLMSGGKR